MEAFLIATEQTVLSETYGLLEVNVFQSPFCNSTYSRNELQPDVFSGTSHSSLRSPQLCSMAQHLHWRLPFTAVKILQKRCKDVFSLFLQQVTMKECSSFGTRARKQLNQHKKQQIHTKSIS